MTAREDKERVKKRAVHGMWLTRYTMRYRSTKTLFQAINSKIWTGRNSQPSFRKEIQKKYWKKWIPRQRELKSKENTSNLKNVTRGIMPTSERRHCFSRKENIDAARILDSTASQGKRVPAFRMISDATIRKNCCHFFSLSDRCVANEQSSSSSERMRRNVLIGERRIGLRSLNTFCSTRIRSTILCTTSNESNRGGFGWRCSTASSKRLRMSECYMISQFRDERIPKRRDRQTQTQTEREIIITW